MTTCPQCQRHLLSHSSARCNWCGKIIEDKDYQTKAYTEREAYFLHQAQHDAQSLVNISAANSYNPYDIGFDQAALGTRPHMPAYQDQSATHTDQGRIRDIAENAEAWERQKEIPPPETPTQGRFQHLEW